MLFCVSLLSLLLLATANSLTEVFRWPGGKPPVAWPNLTWEAEYSRLAVTVIGIKVWADSIYLTAPRWHGNIGSRHCQIIRKCMEVIVTLSMLEFYPAPPLDHHCLSPHPSGENNCQELQTSKLPPQSFPVLGAAETG